MSIIEDTVNYIRESNKEILADYIAEQVLELESEVADLKNKITARRERIDALMKIDFTNIPLLRDTIGRNYGGQILVHDKQYDITKLIDSLPA